jgi:hypothetical protein
MVKVKMLELLSKKRRSKTNYSWLLVLQIINQVKVG